MSGAMPGRERRFLITSAVTVPSLRTPAPAGIRDSADRSAEPVSFNNSKLLFCSLAATI